MNQLKEVSNNQKIFNEIVSVIQNTKFGSVEIVIHNGEVVQIERKEKIRFQ